MLQSHVIEVTGIFVGVAIHGSAAFQFRAVHPAVEALSERRWCSLEELRRAVRHLFTTSRPAAGLADPMKEWPMLGLAE